MADHGPLRPPQRQKRFQLLQIRGSTQQQPLSTNTLGTVIAEIDIWRAAHLMVQQHQDGAEKAARQRAAELNKAGDAEGHTTWLKIATAVVELQRQARAGEALN